MRQVILTCGCHKVSSGGQLFTRIEQLSKKGHAGIITRIVRKWKLVGWTTTKKGYRQVILHGKSVRLNRLIASNFIHNPLNLPESQHRNGNKQDNRTSNLKWGN